MSIEFQSQNMFFVWSVNLMQLSLDLNSLHLEYLRIPPRNLANVFVYYIGSALYIVLCCAKVCILSILKESGNAPVLEEDMVGALDLGGASTQITFIPESKAYAPYSSPRYLFGQKYYVYSYSYLCYGKSASQKRIWATIVGTQTSVSQLAFLS